MQRFDVVVIGAGIAGASLAWALAPRHKVLLLEREAQPGYHSTGRSAATLHRSYGNATIRALTAASAPFYLDPPQGFTESPLASPRGVLVVAGPDQVDLLESEIEQSRRFVPDVVHLDEAGCRAIAGALRPGQFAAGMLDRSLLDLDVNAILAGFLKAARAAGVTLKTDAVIEAMTPDAGGWTLHLADGPIACRSVVNGAGAWADRVAAMAGLEPLGITPKRRTGIIVQPPAGHDISRWPLVADVAELWYIKPDAGRMMCSPADQTPVEPSDVQPDEMDVAVCVDRIETAFDLQIRRIESKWAGLRSFARDKTPVVGFDPRADGFFWLAGQGGYGIQTAPAIARFAAALIGDRPLPADILDAGADPAALSPARLL